MPSGTTPIALDRRPVPSLAPSYCPFGPENSPGGDYLPLLRGAVECHRFQLYTMPDQRRLIPPLGFCLLCASKRHSFAFLFFRSAHVRHVHHAFLLVVQTFALSHLLLMELLGRLLDRGDFVCGIGLVLSHGSG